MNLLLKTFWLGAISLLTLQGKAQTKSSFKAEEVYTSKELTITRISENAFEHTSRKQTDDFGNVPCNGLVVRSRDETVVFDTPTNDKSAEELIAWISGTLHCKINAIIPTHFHDDCLGGLRAFHQHHIPSYAYFKTIELAARDHAAVPENGFTDSLVLKVGDEKVIATFFGEGHTKDNIVGYFPGEKILFGGCLIKELDAGKGYLGDANVAAWPGTVEAVRKAYPDVKTVVPGHGSYGNKALLDFTIRLFKASGKK